MKIRKKIYFIYILVLTVGTIGFRREAFDFKSLPLFHGIDLYALILGMVYFILSMSIMEYFVFGRLKHINKELDALQSNDFCSKKRLFEGADNDEIGTIVRNINETLDIVHKKNNDAKLKGELYASLVNDSPVLVYRFNPKGELTFISDSYAKVNDRNADDMLYENVFDHIKYSGGSVEEIQNKLAILSPKNRTSSFTYNTPLVVNQKIPKWTAWSISAIFDELNHIAEYQAIGVDMYHHDEEKEPQQNPRSNIIYFMSYKGTISYANSMTDTIDLQSIMGTNIIESVHEEDRADFAGGFEQVLKTSNKIHRNCRIKQSDGNYLLMQIALSKSEDEGNKRVVMHAIDMTEINDAQAEVVGAVNNMNRVLVNTNKGLPSSVIHISWQMKDKEVMDQCI